jgi:hypothetical protein
VFHPAGLREVLRKRLLTEAGDLPFGIDDQGARAGGALVDSEDVGWWHGNEYTD